MVAASMSIDDFSPSTYVSRLQDHMRTTRPADTHKSSRLTQVNPGLSSCTHVFVRVDSVKRPLQYPYDGPFKVISRKDKYFTIEKNGKPDS
ncbi:hypothetical protein X801_08741, partial [Opisthorchis viverrini]